MTNNKLVVILITMPSAGYIKMRREPRQMHHCWHSFTHLDDHGRRRRPRRADGPRPPPRQATCTFGWWCRRLRRQYRVLAGVPASKRSSSPSSARPRRLSSPTGRTPAGRGCSSAAASGWSAHAEGLPPRSSTSRPSPTSQRSFIKKVSRLGYPRWFHQQEIIFFATFLSFFSIQIKYCILIYKPIH